MPYKDRKVQSAYQHERQQQRREEWIDGQGRICALCQRADLPFEVDHIDPSTKVSHRIWSWSKERREAELAKCQLLCQECHWDKTATENRKALEHGTRSMYSRRGCRCEACRAANAAYLRQWRSGRERSRFDLTA